MTNKPHDALFKATYRISSEAIAHIQSFHKDIADYLDFSQLKLDDTSYIAGSLKELFSDVVYDCVWEGNTPVKVALLFEHKSYSDKKLPFQLLIYIALLWDRQLSSGEEPTIVLPFVLYHGEEIFEFRKIEDLFEGIDAVLKKFIPSFEYLTTDLRQISQDEMIDLQLGILLSTLLVFKNKRDAKFIEKQVELLFEFYYKGYDSAIIKSFSIKFLNYICNVHENSDLKWDEFAEQLPSAVKSDFMSYHDALIEQGIKKGELEKAEKVVRNLFKKFPNMTDLEVAELAEVSQKFVKETKKKMKEEEPGSRKKK